MTDLVELQRLGPQVPAERGLAARARFHQSWYRYQVLGLARFGSTATGSGQRTLGSILHPDDALAGVNFVTDDARELYRWRRGQGWGLDPHRCTRYLTSSQAMMLNLLGPLWADPSWACRTFSAALGVQIRAMTEFRVEFAPARRSEFLRDQTRVDLWAVFQTPAGPVGVVFEVKYSDRFNSRYINPAERPRYVELAEQVRLWDLSDPAAAAREVNQLLRCHALGAAVWASAHPRRPPPLLVVIHHPEDPVAVQACASYANVLLDQQKLRSVTLGELVGHMEAEASTSMQRRVVDRFKTRYLDHGLSESLWREYRSGPAPERAS